MIMKARIEILNPQTGLYLRGDSVKELKSVFLEGNVISYCVITNDNPLTFETKQRIEVGTPQLNFVFDMEERSVADEVEFMKGRVRELKKIAHKWFDKRTREYKYAYSFPNGFTLPLIFEEIK